jgi:hypothetical protein
MPILTLEGIVENGQIRLRDPVTLPEHTKVYVVPRGGDGPASARLQSTPGASGTRRGLRQASHQANALRAA